MFQNEAMSRKRGKMNTGFYKIRKTEQDLSERLRNLQTGNPRRLEYLVCVEVVDIDAAERAAHHNAIRHHYKQGGTQRYCAGPRHQLDLKHYYLLAVSIISNYSTVII